MTAILILAFTALALAVVLPVFLRPHMPPPDKTRQDNITAAEERLAAVRERELSPRQLAEYESEIESELTNADKETEVAAPSGILRADKTGAAIVCAMLVPGVLALYLLLSPSAPHSAASLADAIAGLEQHIQENPEDAQALGLMARTMAALGREAEAEEYFARARAAEQNNNADSEENNVTSEENNTTSEEQL